MLPCLKLYNNSQWAQNKIQILLQGLDISLPTCLVGFYLSSSLSVLAGLPYTLLVSIAQIFQFHPLLVFAVSSACKVLCPQSHGDSFITVRSHQKFHYLTEPFASQLSNILPPFQDFHSLYHFMQLSFLFIAFFIVCLLLKVNSETWN